MFISSMNIIIATIFINVKRDTIKKKFYYNSAIANAFFDVIKCFFQESPFKWFVFET